MMKNILDRLALVLTGQETRRVTKQILPFVAWIELRIDCFLQKFRENDLLIWVKQIRQQANKKKIIGTVRWKKEQFGAGIYLSPKKRKRLYELVLPYVDYVDVEMQSSIACDIVNMAHQQRKKVILSYHNFMCVPPESTLECLYKKVKSMHGDIMKLACVPRTCKEVCVLFHFTCAYSARIPLIVTPMKVSPVERLVPLLLGSILTYVSAEKATAPGQIAFYDVLRYARNGLLGEKYKTL